MLYVNPLDSMYAASAARVDRAQARETQALEEFERLFLYQFLRELRKTIPEDTLLGRSSQRDYFEQMFDDVLAGQMAQSRQLGIAEQIARQIAGPDRAPAHPAPLKQAAPAADNYPRGDASWRFLADSARSAASFAAPQAWSTNSRRPE